MIKGFNEFYVEAGIPIDSRQIKLRFEGIENFCNELNCENVCELLRIYYDLKNNKDFYDDFVQHFTETDPNFSSKYTKEIKLLVGCALVYITESQSDLGHFVELLLAANALFHLPPSNQIHTRILKRFDEDRIALRAPQKIEIDSVENLLEELNQKYEEGEDFQAELLNLIKEEHSCNKELLSTLQIYREDSQILWWMNSKWCSTLDCELKSLTKKQACLIIGSEAAELVENYPGPFSINAVLKAMISASKGNNSKMSIDEVLSNTDSRYKENIVSQFDNSTIIDLVPLHAAVCREFNTTSFEQWYPKYEQEILRGNKLSNCTLDEYSFRMFLESLVLKLYNNLSSKGGK